MSIDEIEILGTSLSLKCYKATVDSIPAVFERILQEADQFSLEPECPGFHDCDIKHDPMLIRGGYSGVVPFEVEHLVEGIPSKSLLKRIETCEFLFTPGMLFAMGRPGPMKGLSTVLSSLTGYAVSLCEFEFRQMSQFSERLSQLKSIVLLNPKDREVRRARLAGSIENYVEYNVIDPRNHEIDQVSGLIDSPLGPLTLTVGKRGSLRIGARRGFILSLPCLLWLVALILEDKPPQATAPNRELFPPTLADD